MSRKRRVFDIALPEDDVTTPPPAAASDEPPRRGPMASAIAENAEALQARKSAVEAIREENDALAHEYVALREAGNVVENIPLDRVHTYMLTRDRIPGDDMEMEDLVTSIRELGLSNPIRVIPRLDDTGYELVQGYRRLTAYRRLHADDPDGGWGEIPALIMPGERDVAGLYRRMVDENIVRKDLSFAEMAYAAQNYAADHRTKARDTAEAVAELFQSAPYSKRSYIRSFAYMLDMLPHGVLHYPTSIPRALGVALAREIKERPEIIKMIKEDLKDWDGRSIQQEHEVLRKYTNQLDSDHELPAPKKKAVTETAGRTKTTFHMQSRAGQVKCTAGPGRLEIKVDRDFSTLDQARLQRAIAALIDGLA